MGEPDRGTGTQLGIVLTLVGLTLNPEYIQDSEQNFLPFAYLPYRSHIDHKFIIPIHLQ